jgi:hypothetical protein
VTAVRKAGCTVRVRIESLAGEPAVLRVPAGNAALRLDRSSRAHVQPLPACEWRLRRGERVELVAPGIGRMVVLAPVAQEPGSPVPFGVR